MAPRRKAKTGMVKPKITLKEAIIRVLQEAGPGGLTVKEIVQRIKKKKWWDWKNDKAGSTSVSNTCLAAPDTFVKHSHGVYALKSLQGRGEGPSQRYSSCKETDNGSGSSSMICEETCVSSKQDEEEEEDQAMDVKATTLTASGRVSKVPPRLSSVEEWKRVMVSELFISSILPHPILTDRNLTTNPLNVNQ